MDELALVRPKRGRPRSPVLADDEVLRIRRVIALECLVELSAEAQEQLQLERSSSSSSILSTLELLELLAERLRG
jgi:hypothetical protein